VISLQASRRLRDLAVLERRRCTDIVANGFDNLLGGFMTRQVPCPRQIETPKPSFRVSVARSTGYAL
jgi:hypothetical protein